MSALRSRGVRSDRTRVTLAELQRRPVPPAAAHVGTAVLPLGAPTARDAEADQWGEPSVARA
jgi:hypothetical protein